MKQLGRIKGVGHRITGVPTHRNRGIGRDYVQVCLEVQEIMTDNGRNDRSRVQRPHAGLTDRPPISRLDPGRLNNLSARHR